MLVIFIPSYNAIGILGGMGPEATAELYLRIIRIFQSRGAKYDSDFPKIFIYNLPLQDIVEREADDKTIISSLIEGLRTLESSGSSFIGIACNSLYSYYRQIQQAVSIPIIDLIGETCNFIAENNYKSVGILGTGLTIKNKLFEKNLKGCGVRTIISTSSQQKSITKIIMNILEGKKLNSDKIKLFSIIGNLKDKGAECIILGCTELPLLLSKSDCDLELIDTIDILAKAIVKNSVKQPGGKLK